MSNKIEFHPWIGNTEFEHRTGRGPFKSYRAKQRAILAWMMSQPEIMEGVVKLRNLQLARFK